ncbi:MAG: hypothetical protein ABI729_02095 [Chitinophagales bacterium]
MAINKNHEFEDLEGVKCAVVEKNVTPVRTDFLKKILEFNGYTVVVVKSPPPKVAAAKVVPVTDATAETIVTADKIVNEPPPPPETYTVGVTDVMFNSTNAIFGRQLKTASGHIITLAYWEQQDDQPHDEIPYYETRSH